MLAFRNDRFSRAGPMVRIRFPPADSPFSPAATFEGREPPLSARVWAAGLATGSARDAPGFPFRANRRQYLCRAIFRYPMPLMWSAIIPRRSQQSRVFSVLNACVDLIQIGLKQSRARSADRARQAADVSARGASLPSNRVAAAPSRIAWVISGAR